jgi:hypothetical protein
MVKQENRLPGAFEDLEGFIKKWALTTADERLQNRMSSSMDEIQTFYDAMLPRVEQALEHLDRFPLDNMPPAETCLYYLVLASAEASLSVEVYGAPRLPLAPEESRFKVTHVHMGT